MKKPEFESEVCFEGGLEGNLVVSYNDGGVGYDGPLSDCEIEEIKE